MIEQKFLLVILLLLGVYISLRSYETYSPEEDKDVKKSTNPRYRMSTNNKSPVCNTDENINKFIENAFTQYRKDLGKYNIGSKSYKYDFIDNEQPINGLSPSYVNNYPSTLKESNKMIVDQDTYKGNYTNLLNTQNNLLKTYYNDVPKY